MTEPYVGEIQLFGFNFAPRGFAQCAGQLVAIRQNTALFSLLGTQYGGDGTTTFALPDFAQRSGCNQGQGPGLTQRFPGEAFGQNTVTLTAQEMPAHTHSATIFVGRGSSGRVGVPQAGYALTNPSGSSAFVDSAAPNATLSPLVLQTVGASQPHENRQPLLAVEYCIALEGVFPAFP